MNVFAVSRHTRICARALDDKRLNKMILETAQILCTVINLEYGGQVTHYRNSHEHHPITLWAKDKDYQCWLWHLGIDYGTEIIHRHRRTHSSLGVLMSLTKFKPQLALDYDIMHDEDFCNCARRRDLGLDFTHLPTRQAYREYLSTRWPNDKRAPTWTNRRPPSWS